MNEVFDFDVFISFSNKDEYIVRPLWQNLSLCGLRVFWSNEGLKKEAGKNWSRIIEKALEKSRHFLLICTENSMSSNYVELEYRAFHDQFYLSGNGLRLFIIKPENNYKVSSLPLFLKQIQVENSVENLIKILGGTNMDELILENETLRGQNLQLTNENKKLIDKIKELEKNPHPNPPNSPDPIAEPKDCIYISRQTQLYDKPNGKQIGALFNSGHRFEYVEIDSNGWYMIKTDNKKLWLNPSVAISDDPKSYFEIVEKKMRGYLFGNMYNNTSIGDLKTLSIIDSGLGKVDLEIKKIKEIKITDNNEAPVEIITMDGLSYTGTTSYSGGYEGGRLRTYFVSGFAFIEIHTAKNITIRQVI